MVNLLFISRESNVSGNARHGVIYPQKSSWACYDVLKSKNDENYQREIGIKITIEDGKFSLSSRRGDYTGQHTNLFYDSECQCPVNQDIIMNHKYLYGFIFSRNKYGGHKAYFRIDCLSGNTQIQRGSKGTYFDFSPRNYID